MERWLRAVVVVCLAMLLTWNGAVADEKAADNNACTYFNAIDNNGDLYATYFDFICEWLRIPLIGGGDHLVRDAKRQLVILLQFIDQFPLTDKKLIESLLTGGISLDEFLNHVRRVRYLPTFKSQIAGLMTFLFKVFNYNGDEGNLDPYEFAVLYRVFNIPDSTTSFSKLDVDGNNKVSYDEACTAALDYFITANDPRSAYLIGPPRTCDDVRKRVPTWVDPIVTGRLVLTLDVFGSIGALANLLRDVSGLSDLLPYLLGELLGIVPAIVAGLIG